MAAELWLNLPVSNVAASRVFFSKLGFRLAKRGEHDGLASLLFGEPPFVVNLFPRDTFAGFVRGPVADPTGAAEILLSLHAETRADVDNLTELARDAGAAILEEPAERDGWMYGSMFADPDGHRWNVLWMEPAKVPIDADIATLEAGI